MNTDKYNSVLWNRSQDYDDLVVTPIDLDSIQSNPDEFKKLILSSNSKFLALNNQELVDLFNRLYQRAVLYLEEELFYEKQDLGKLPSRVFNNWDDIASFIQDTKKIKGKTKCTILKYMLSINDSSDEFNPNIVRVKEKTQRVLERKLKGPLQILEENDNGDIRGVVSLQRKTISFKLTKREKTNNSSVSKEIRDPEYRFIERSNDQYGVTFSGIEEVMIPMFMEYISHIVFKKGVYEMKDQGVLNEEVIKNDTYISDGFRKKLLDSLDSEQKNETAKDYKVIKIVTPLGKDDEINNLSLEIKFEPKQSENESGIEMQGVYAYFKKISERIRTEQYIRPGYVDLVVSKFIENLQDVLNENINREDKNIHTYKLELFNSLKHLRHIPQGYDLRNTHTKSHLDDILHMGLVSYYKSKLRPVQINNKGKTYYANSRSLKVSELGIWKNILSGTN